MKVHSQNNRARRGYTLIEALMASAILMIGVGAAASMSLTMVTQEEINERTVRSMNHLENAASLYRMGVDPADIVALLPADPVIRNLNINERTRNIPTLGAVPTVRMTVVFKPSGAARKWAAGKWVSGDKTFNRNHTIEVFRGSSFVTP